MNLHSLKYEHNRFMLIYAMMMACTVFVSATVSSLFILLIPVWLLIFQLYIWSARGKASVKEAVTDFINDAIAKYAEEMKK